MKLTIEQRRIAGMFCEIEQRGPTPYCYSHHCKTRGDLVACLDAEDVAEQLFETLEETKHEAS